MMDTKARREAEEQFPALPGESFESAMACSHLRSGYVAAAKKYLPQLAEKDKVIEGLRAAWVDVKEQMPDVAQQVVVREFMDGLISYRVVTYKLMPWSRYYTHLMPLPEDPSSPLSSLAPTGTR